MPEDTKRRDAQAEEHEGATTKYRTGRDWEEEADDGDGSGDEYARVETKALVVEVKHSGPTLERDMKYKVHVTWSDEFGPVAAFVRASHRLSGSNQYDLDGKREFRALPTEVRSEVADRVVGVSEPSDLDPDHWPDTGDRGGDQ